MAETVNIENSKYEFEVLLVARVQSGSSSTEYEYKSVPISKSSIKHLEITDDLVNFGYTGTITFTNYFGILQKLGMYNIADEAPFIHVRFKNLDFAAAGKVAPSIYFIGSLGKSFESSSNVIDKHASFEFEEYLVAKLKRVTVKGVLSDTAAVGRGEFGDMATMLGPVTNTPANLIQGLISKGLRLSGITSSVSISGTPIEDDIHISDAGITDNKTSIFDSVKILSSFLSFTLPSDIPGQLSDFVAPGIVKVENTPDLKQRQVIIKSLVDEINGFFKLIKTNKTSDKISNYLTEKFSISLSNDSRTYGDNFISKYNLLRVNYQDVYENKWVNTEAICGTVDCTFNSIREYELLRVAFERLFTAPFATNIPKRTDDINNDRVKTITYSAKNLPDKLAIGLGTNRIFKSFIFDNVALTFRVKGQPYRSAGKFIQIEADGSSTSGTSKNTKSDELNGYWYIISLKHIFENDIYFNDYVCVKLYSNYGALSEIPERDVRPTNSIGSSGLGRVDRVVGDSEISSYPQLGDIDAEFLLPPEGIAEYNRTLGTLQELNTTPAYKKSQNIKTFEQVFDTFEFPSLEQANQQVDEILGGSGLLPPLPD